jgi:hypothetical protein
MTPWARNIISNTPSNFLKNSNVNPKVKITKEEGIEIHSLICNTTGVKGVCWSSRMGTRTNSQVRVQNEVNLHNQ